MSKLVTLRKARQQLLPARQPHPDPGIEAELQRIVSLRRSIARKEALLDAGEEHITRLRRTTTRHPTWAGHLDRLDQITTLLDEAGTLDAEIQRLHDEIAERIDRLDVTDAAYLAPAPRTTAEVNGELIRTPRPLGTEEAARDWAANL